jgi:hypothetical protein
MNFKTTIMLFLTLLVVGIIFFTSNKSTKQNNSQETQTPPGEGKKLISLESSDVKGITITDADGNRTAVRQDGAAWKMTDPIAAPAVDWQTTDLIRTICELRSQGRPDSAPSDSGLDKPQYTVDLIGNDGRSTRLVIGNKTGIGDVMYAQVDGGDINLIDSSLAKTLKTAADDLRDKHLLTAGMADYKQVRITSPTQTVEMQKEGDRWIITKPDRMPGDSESISSLISTITGTEATQFVKSDSDELPYARFDHPTLQVWMSTEAPTTQPAATEPSGVTLTIGAPDSLAKDHYFAETSDGLIAKIDKSSLESLQKTPLDLRDREAVSIVPADVTQVSVVKVLYPPLTSAQATQPSVAKEQKPLSSHLVLLKRRPKQAAVMGPTPKSKATTAPAMKPAQSAWMFGIPDEPKSQVDDSKVDALLEKFSPLRADKYLEKVPDGPIDTKFIVTLETKSLNKYHIEITKPANGQTVFATYNGLIFELPTATIDAMDTDFHKIP